MTTCPACAASVRADAEWCGQCYQRLAASAPPAPVPAGVLPGNAEPAYALDSTDRWGIVRSAAPVVPSQPTYGQPTYEQPTPAPVPYSRTAWAPPTPQPSEPPRTGSLGSWGRGSTGYTVIGAIVIGALMQLVMYLITKNGTIEVETFVRYAIVATIGFYAIVSVIVLRKLHAGAVRLYWTDGKPAVGIAMGLGVGLSLGLLLLGINSAINGHLTTDPSATLMTSEGDAGHILAAILIAMIAAPLVEETLFRGLLAESLRPKGAASAIWLSAIAFAAWHLNPSALRYYALMGALLGWLYWKRGLVASIATHASFNGVLTIAAVVIALSPGVTVQTDGLTLEAPRGWHQVSEAVPTGLVAVQGPSHAAVLIMDMPNSGGATTVDHIIAQINAGEFDGRIPSDEELSHSEPTRRHIPAGDVATMQLSIEGRGGQMVWLPSVSHIYVIVLETSGSVKAKQDFETMLQSIRLS